MAVPVAVKEAIENFRDTELFTLLPPKPNESSYIYKWGVRVIFKDNDEAHVGWICLADEQCREALRFIPMYSGKTSKATAHLSKVHNCSSEKYAAELNRKRSREEELEELRGSAMATEDPKRMRLLLETKRIVFNNLPFRSLEYDESRLIDELCTKAEFQQPIHAKMVNHSIVELYATTKREILGVLQKNQITSTKALSVVADFWTCKTQHQKYLGVRVFFVNQEWKIESILLGTRRFNPDYADRASSIRQPFRRWLTQMFEDFGLTKDNVFGGMSDAGPDVKWMLQSGLDLRWEWCIAHMSNAATKWACGMVSNRSESRNPGMTDLVSRICKTVRQVRDVEVMGSLFEALCDLEGHGSAPRLLDYKSHRFLGLTVVVRRVLDRWVELEQWFAARIERAQRENQPVPEFPLEGKRIELVQLLSLLEPITSVNRLSQGNGPGQVEVLLTLFALRIQTLDATTRLRDYRSAARPAPQMYFQPSELTPLINTTRTMLRDAFDRNFFSRYLDRSTVRRQSFVLEMQLLLHPTFRKLEGNLAHIVRLCYRRRDSRRDICDAMADHVCETVVNKAKKVMAELAADEPVTTPAPPNAASLSEDLVVMFGSVQPSERPRVDIRESQIDEELSRWQIESFSLAARPDGTTENVLQFWRRQAESNNFKYLPKLARVLFAMPCSSAQIERDFGASGMMVTPQRSSLASYNVDMASFLSSNREYVSLTQCMRIPKENVSDFIPTHMLVGSLDDDVLDQVDSDIMTYFSGMSTEHLDDDGDT